MHHQCGLIIHSSTLTALKLFMLSCQIYIDGLELAKSPTSDCVSDTNLCQKKLNVHDTVFKLGFLGGTQTSLHSNTNRIVHLVKLSQSRFIQIDNLMFRIHARYSRS